MTTQDKMRMIRLMRANRKLATREVEELDGLFGQYVEEETRGRYDDEHRQLYKANFSLVTRKRIAEEIALP